MPCTRMELLKMKFGEFDAFIRIPLSSRLGNYLFLRLYYGLHKNVKSMDQNINPRNHFKWIHMTIKRNRNDGSRTVLLIHFRAFLCFVRIKFGFINTLTMPYSSLANSFHLFICLGFFVCCWYDRIRLCP